MNLKFHTVSKSLPRHEAASKASGKAIYTDDIHLPGMVYGMILRSPYAHARVLRNGRFSRSPASRGGPG